MFDEASNIQMRGNQNVFVNVCLYSGDVKTLSLALQVINIISRHILRPEMTAEQVWAHMLVLYNGPTTVAAYANKLNVDSRVPGWWGHVNQSNCNN